MTLCRLREAVFDWLLLGCSWGWVGGAADCGAGAGWEDVRLGGVGD